MDYQYNFNPDYLDVCLGCGTNVYGKRGKGFCDKCDLPGTLYYELWLPYEDMPYYCGIGNSANRAVELHTTTIDGVRVLAKVEQYRFRHRDTILKYGPVGMARGLAEEYEVLRIHYWLTQGAVLLNVSQPDPQRYHKTMYEYEHQASDHMYEDMDTVNSPYIL